LRAGRKPGFLPTRRFSDDSNQAGGQQAAGLLLLVTKAQSGCFIMALEHPAWRVILIDPEER